jgi:hypothetical protein
MSLVLALAPDVTLVLYLVEIVEQLLVVVGSVPHCCSRRTMSPVSAFFVEQLVVGALYYCRRTKSLVLALALNAAQVLYSVELVVEQQNAVIQQWQVVTMDAELVTQLVNYLETVAIALLLVVAVYQRQTMSPVLALVLDVARVYLVEVDGCLAEHQLVAVDA